VQPAAAVVAQLIRVAILCGLTQTTGRSVPFLLAFAPRLTAQAVFGIWRRRAFVVAA
jgi:hypothetical protein